MQSIEAINSEPGTDGKFPKDSLTHGKKVGGFYPLGKVRGASRVLIAEGVATAAVGAEVDKSPAMAAMGKSNLFHVARAVRELAPKAEIIMLADNDLKLPKEAHEAAVAVGGRVVVPQLDGRECDLWDVWNEHGIEAVRAAIAGVGCAMTRMTETPQQAARRLSASAVHKPEALHTYTHLDGGAWYWRIRLKKPATRDKWIRPVRVNGAGFELGEPEHPNGKPLYRLHQLATRPSDPVVVCEGEWCAEALAKARVLATTSGEADSAANTDWRPLAGRCVTIWPDDDEAGRRYAQEVTEKLLQG